MMIFLPGKNIRIMVSLYVLKKENFITNNALCFKGEDTLQELHFRFDI